MTLLQNLEVLPQPDDNTCGPTCLHAVYGYYGDDCDLEDVVAGVPELPQGGTLAVALARHALRRGYRATIYTYNLQLFDPTWFASHDVDIAGKLDRQNRRKADPKLRLAGEAYREYLAEGGRLLWEDLTPSLIRRHLRRGEPILTGLSATYLYHCARELDGDYDDVAGDPMGHFVVLSGYDPTTRTVRVADPLGENPRYDSHYYHVGLDRLVGAILLGILTYDANLLVITPNT